MLMKAILLIILFGIHGRCKSPNIVLFLTDDQDVLLKSMDVMTKTRALLAENGATFTNMFVNTPICCPSRSTILTGKYIHNLGVRNNSLSGNCSSVEFQRNHEINSIAAILKRHKGYNTFYAGKYLNQYGTKKAGGLSHVPVGYDWWVGLEGNSKYYNYTLSINGTAKHFADNYLTDELKHFGLDFLNQKHVLEKPFFMTFSTSAPHAPFTPAPKHAKRFGKLKAVRTPSFNISSKNKHWLVEFSAEFLPSDIYNLDEIQRNRLRTLLSVDNLIERILRKLQKLNILNNTYVIFTSDNGYHIGQFCQPFDKRQPYETDIRVPFLLRGRNIQKNRTFTTLVSMVDLAPSILSLASIPVPKEMDGQSFIDNGQLVEDLKSERIVFIEYYGEGNKNSIDKECPTQGDQNLAQCTKDSFCKCQDSKNNTYTCLRSIDGKTNFKFCQFDDDLDFIEAYDLNTDPYELNNIKDDLNSTIIQMNKDLLEEFKKCIGSSCREFLNKSN